VEFAVSQSREEREAAAKARMAELAARFVERSAGEFAAMRDCLARVLAGDLHALDEIRHLAHRMGGTGATLGFDTLADCAQRIEKLTDSNRPGGDADASARLHLSTAVDAFGIELGRLKGI
jgi:HPt (histidine-containing phosphotransfer) domain-containing protein